MHKVRKVDRKIRFISMRGHQMQLSLKAVAAAVALALGSTSAMAVDSTTTGNSSLFVTAYDAVLGASIVKDLGLNYADFLEAAVTPDTGSVLNFTLDMSVFTSVGSNPNDIRWSVYAADGSGNFAAREVLTTAALDLGTITGINSHVTGAITAANGVYAQWNTACGAAAETCIGTNNSSTYFGGFGEDLNNGVLFPTSGALGTALGFYSLRASTPGAGDPLVSAQYANSSSFAQWLLDANGNLTYSIAAAPVPLPAALWLLLSGIAGVGVIGRRKAAV
jgi:hypothetical protein